MEQVIQKKCMKKIAVIGAGISGLTVSNILRDDYDVIVFETSSKPGGLIKCKRVDGNLYHIVGGHVFNSKREDVLNWFWKFFDKDNEFVKATRNASVFLNKPIGYPIENHIFDMQPDIQKQIISDLLTIATNNNFVPTNFEEFLKARFGKTLYELYFKPYNEKVWNKPLSTISLDWLEDKLPMPTVQDIIFNNFRREKEMTMVHSSFYYPKSGGSQFIADRLSEKLTIRYNTEIKEIRYDNNVWSVDNENFDIVLYTGNIKELPSMLPINLLSEYKQTIKNLQYHGTTSVLCKINKNPYSWMYLPDKQYKSHRIICTGNFAPSNNAKVNLTATVEFTDEINKETIMQNLSHIPYSPKYITHQYTEYTYPIQTPDTRLLVRNIKKSLEPRGLFLSGRFAEWEYYNMDAAIGAAIDLTRKIKNTNN
ncbi:MAG: hypothetical protein EZS26_000320 [Candidatus Ordinivivax streblomastigis]|uniref:UDP-galactopyranose mutase n=1 Tax=Candidatus Ordinivivax streblomastigis TaxID=2540710 RepID=A0A5M8P5H0_9BACT|nr:MAG: hypothetical protein EZS26_000320 [Candidatus Ordinivivax streblomastigis]